MTMPHTRVLLRARARRWAVLAALASLALPLAPPAHGAVSVLTDPAGDTRYVPKKHSGDIVKVRVEHAPRALRVTVRHAPDSGVTDVYLLWIDTDPRDPGPEYRTTAVAEVEAATVARVTDWGRSSGRGVRCPGARVAFFFDQEPSTPVRMTFPRSCLGNPARVRVSVATEPDYPFKRIDWAPGIKKFGRWLRSG